MVDLLISPAMELEIKVVKRSCDKLEKSKLVKLVDYSVNAVNTNMDQPLKSSLTTMSRHMES